MEKFLTFFKENYSYFVYAFQFLLFLLSFFLVFFKYLRMKKYYSLNKYLTEVNDNFSLENDFLSFLPSWIESANVLYPYHGDGLKRFDYVYRKALDLFNEEPSDHFKNYVSDSVDQILNCDKLEKISRDTQDFEPKKEFIYEKKEDGQVERSEDLRQDGEENESAECSACYVSRRY